MSALWSSALCDQVSERCDAPCDYPHQRGPGSAEWAWPGRRRHPCTGRRQRFEFVPQHYRAAPVVSAVWTELSAGVGVSEMGMQCLSVFRPAQWAGPWGPCSPCSGQVRGSLNVHSVIEL